MNTMTAMTRRMWINPPPIWKLNPRSQSMSSMTKIVSNIRVSLGVTEEVDAACLG
jgi:hypothetical protein